MPSKSTAKRPTVKRYHRKPTDPPEKPYPEFPLRPHPTGYWCKKIKGQTVYFGPWAKREDGKLICLPDGGNYSQAKALYDESIHDIQADIAAGRKPWSITASENATGLTVKELCNVYLTNQVRKLNAKEFTAKSFSDCKNAAELLTQEFGAKRRVESLKPADFESLREVIATRWGLNRRGKMVQLIKSVFKYGAENGHVKKTIRMGSNFKRPSKKIMRKHKAASPKKLFRQPELQLILDALEGKEVTVTASGKPVKVTLAANPQLRAMVLLALNGGLGNTDIGNMEFANVSMSKGWIDFPRVKTGMPRRFPLWADTLAAIKVHLITRREAKHKDDDDCVFLNRAGARMVQEHRQDIEEDGKVVDVKTWSQDYVSSQFRTLLAALHLNRKGASFYALRHTFSTVALQAGDRDCVRAIMGHSANDMLDEYDEEGPDDSRRIRVVQHVHNWLFSGV